MSLCDPPAVSQVAGRADILPVADLEAGNMLAKQLTFMAGAEAVGWRGGRMGRCHEDGGAGIDPCR
jgi:hypothetical protein